MKTRSVFSTSLVSVFMLSGAVAAPPFSTEPLTTEQEKAPVPEQAPVFTLHQAELVSSKSGYVFDVMLGYQQERGADDNNIQSFMNAEISANMTLEAGRLADDERLRREATFDLAALYAASNLWIEAFAVIEPLRDTALSPDERLFAAYCAFFAQKDIAVLALTADEQNNAAGHRLLRSAAYSRLGAWREAARLAREEPWELSPATIHENPDIVRPILEAMLRSGLQNDKDAIRRRLAAYDFDPATRGLFTQLLSKAAAVQPINAHRSQTPIVNEMRVRSALLVLEEAFLSGQTPSDDTAREARLLALQWKSDPVARDALYLEGRALVAGGKAAEGFDVLRALVEVYPESDVAHEAGQTITDALPSLFAMDGSLAPKDAAAVFYDFAEFAPPGAEGDQLIRDVTDQLVEIGLYTEAERLLDHQVFNRLRGRERSIVAARLASVQMDARKAEAALRTIRSTRISGLDQTYNLERKKLELQALLGLGRADDALALLGEPTNTELLREKADILWRLERWDEAGTVYSALFDREEGAAAEAAAARAATAYLSADAQEAYQTIHEKARARFGDENASVLLIDAIGDSDQAIEALDQYHAVFARRDQSI